MDILGFVWYSDVGGIYVFLIVVIIGLVCFEVGFILIFGVGIDYFVDILIFYFFFLLRYEIFVLFVWMIFC